LAEGRVKLIGTAGEVVARLAAPPSAEGVA